MMIWNLSLKINKMKQKEIKKLMSDYTILKPLIAKAMDSGKTFEDKIRNVRDVYREYFADDNEGDMYGLFWFSGYFSGIKAKVFSSYKDIGGREI